MRRKTAEEKRLAGTARADRQAAGQQPGVGDMPWGLGKMRHAARLWKALAGELGAELRPADAAAMHIACLHYQIAMDALAELQDGAIVVADTAHGGVRRNPAQMVFLQHSQALLTTLKELGATPKSRPAGAGQREDTLAEMLSLMTHGG
jgi:phage terminase small subunit